MKKFSGRGKKNKIIQRLCIFAAMAGLLCCSFSPMNTDAADTTATEVETAAFSTETVSESQKDTVKETKGKESAESQTDSETEKTAKNSSEDETKSTEISYTDGKLESVVKESKDAGGYTVTVNYDAKAEIPADATLKTSEILKDSKDYENYFNKANEALSEKNLEIANARIFNIEIQDAEGNVIEPKDEVKVEISYDDPVKAEAEDNDYQIIHFAKTDGVENETPDVITNVKTIKDDEKDEQVSGFQFKTDSFSVYVSAETTQSAESGSEIEQASESESSTARRAAAKAAVQATSETTSTETETDLPVPEVKKTLNYRGTNNDGKTEDGTYDLTLSVTGRAKSTESSNKVNVVVVFDRSDSMTNKVDDTSNVTRLRSAKDAVENLGEELFELNTDPNDPTASIRMIYFDGHAYNDNIEYTDTGKFNSAVEKIEAVHGDDDHATEVIEGTFSDDPGGTTNWEDALQKANEVTFTNNPNAPVYVVFISDGDPTVRNTRMPEGTTYINGPTRLIEVYPDYRQKMGTTISDSHNYDFRFTGFSSTNTVYGCGFGETLCDTDRLNYSAALINARNIVSSKKQFYTIATFNNSNSVARLEQLTNDAYSPESAEGHYYNTTNADELNSALESLAKIIKKTAAFDGVVLHDTLTKMTNADIKVGGVQDGEFTYSKKKGNTPVDWKTKDKDGKPTPPVATINQETGEIEWDLSSEGELEEGVTYSVTFRVWPNQEAYDLVAKLDNGEIDYKSLTEEQKKQLIQNSDGTYSVNNDLKEFVQNSDGTYSLYTNEPGTHCDYNRIYTETPITTFPEGVSQEDLDNGEVITIEGDDGFTYVYEKKDGKYVETKKKAETEPIDNPDPMPLVDTEMTVSKVWENMTDAEIEKIQSVTINVMWDAECDGNTNDKYETLVLTKDASTGEWKATVKIPVGLISNNQTNVDETIETGHVFALTEPTITYTSGTNLYTFDKSYSGSIHPMLVNGRDETHIVFYDSTENKNKLENAVIICTNKKTTTDLVLKKVDSADTSIVVDGAEFKLTKEDGTVVVEKITSDANGLIELKDLSPGTYKLTETKAKDGYSLPKDSWTIVVGDNTVEVKKPDGTVIEPNKDNQYEIENTMHIILKKIKASDSSTVTALGGVEFQLYKVEGSNESKFGNPLTSTKDGGLITLTKLEPGTYKLYETKAKDGYYLPEKPWTITVTKDENNHLKVEVKDQEGNEVPQNECKHYVITNTEIYELPSTGGIGTTPFKAVGAAMMLTTVLGYLSSRRKKEERGLQ